MSFKKNKYVVIKKAISKDMALFLYNYLLIKRQVTHSLFEKKYISPFERIISTFGDGQVPKAFCTYGDTAMETLLLKTQPLVEKQTGLKLLPNYSYARIYGHGDELVRHIDRFSCEVSTTIHLGGEPWPICIDPTGKETLPGAKDIPKGISIDLKPGDMLVYRGDLLEHWRNFFNGENHAQVFLHYGNSKTKQGKSNIYDGRIHLGLIKDPVFLQQKDKK